MLSLNEKIKQNADECFLQTKTSEINSKASNFDQYFNGLFSLIALNFFLMLLFARDPTTCKRVVMICLMVFKMPFSVFPQFYVLIDTQSCILMLYMCRQRARNLGYDWLLLTLSIFITTWGYTCSYLGPWMFITRNVDISLNISKTIERWPMVLLLTFLL